jgi:predicted Zn-dependent protease
MLKLASLNEGDPDMMVDLGKFFLRNGKLDKADQYLRDAYSFNIKNHQLGFMYASYLLQQDRSKEAIVILNKLQKDNYEPIKVNLLMSLAYESDQDPLLALKYKSIAFTHRLRELELIPLAGLS